ncbi:MAG: hypothetical protein Q7T03_03705, partial [Deltaproteobacteria bacterium]|nr:hypothetical protein [Deltaproteobacteria bacterium]
PDETLKTVVELADPIRETNFPRKAVVSVLERVVSQMERDGDPSDTITPDHVRKIMVEKFMAELASTADAAIERINLALEDPQAILETNQRSATAVLKIVVKGFDGFAPEKQEKLMAILVETWRNAAPEIKAANTPSGTPKHHISENFALAALNRASSAEGLDLIPPPVTPASPTSAAPKGGTGPIGGGTGGGTVAGGSPPLPTPASPAAPTTGAGTVTRSTLTTAELLPERQALARELASLKENVDAKAISHIQVRPAIGFAMTAGPAMAFSLADHAGVPKGVTGAVGAGIGIWAIRENPLVGGATMVLHGAYFLSGKFATAAALDSFGEKTGIESLRHGTLTNSLISDAGGGLSWLAFNTTSKGRPEKWIGKIPGLKTADGAMTAMAREQLQNVRIATSMYRDQIVTAGRAAVQVGAQAVQTARQAAPTAAGFAAGALTMLKTTGAVIGTAVSTSAVAAGAAVVGTGAASYGATYYVADHYGIHGWIADNVLGVKGYDTLPESKVAPKQPEQRENETPQVMLAMK